MATSRKYFGTDGVRGTVGDYPMTADFALKLGNAAARVLVPGGGKALIGKVTRLSGYMFESALQAGLTAAGVDVALIGPLPTPGIAYMTKQLDCDFGVVISASHNHFNDNGIKFFDGNGEKLSDESEAKIEALLGEEPVTRESRAIGKASRAEKRRTEYQDFCAATLPPGMRLDGFKLVVDCANGAGYKVAPRTFADLDADVVPIGTAPNGRNINEGCGATDPSLLKLMVPGVAAHAGIALDGDGDRLIMVDERGEVVDGDALLFILAKAKREDGTLRGPVVGTVMSNIGLELAIREMGIEFVRARVGDRYVLESLRKTDGNLGGETSGHILMLDKATTGDGIVNALAVLAVMQKSGKPLSELAGGFARFPQILLNVKMEKRFEPFENETVAAAVKKAETELGKNGRVVLRASGTEPLIRIMVEARAEGEARRHAESLKRTVEQAAP